MSRVCVNPLDPVIHDGPGGDQFCIFCLRKRGDDALQVVASLVAVLREVEWSAQYGYDETAGACPSCRWPEHATPRRKACTFGHYDRQQGCSSCSSMGDTPTENDRTHGPDCALSAAVTKAEGLLV